MTSMVIWMIGIGSSVSLLVLSAALKLYYVHIAVTALVAILVALSAFGESRLGVAGDTANGQRASTNLRHMGLVWTWGALTLFVTYAFKILEWREWWHFFIALLVLAGLTLFLSATLKKDAEANNSDDMMFKVARGFSIFVLIAMLITMAGLLIDGKMWRFTTVAGQRIGSQDWAANNIFFFGALALAAVSWNSISVLTGPKR